MNEIKIHYKNELKCTRIEFEEINIQTLENGTKTINLYIDKKLIFSTTLNNIDFIYFDGRNVTP